MKTTFFLLVIGIGVMVIGTVGIGNTASIECIEVKNGTLTTTGNETVVVEKGTFCASPADMELAKKIVERNAEVEKLKISLETMFKKLETTEKYWISRESEIDKYYSSIIRDLTITNELLNNWWNKWGKSAFFSILAVGATSFVVYEVSR